MGVNDEWGREFLLEVGMLCCSARVLPVLSAMFSRLRQHAKKALITSLTNVFSKSGGTYVLRSFSMKYTIYRAVYK